MKMIMNIKLNFYNQCWFKFLKLIWKIIIANILQYNLIVDLSVKYIQQCRKYIISFIKNLKM